MKFLRWLVTWALYGLGHGIYLIMNRWDIFQIHVIYNNLMIWSNNAQGKYLGKYWVWSEEKG
jgi:hypothetical protein